MRILLAEDEVALSRALVKILEKNNFSVDAVCNGEEAIDFAKAGNYDAIIMDIMMPRVDGLTALRTLRARGSAIPILLLTAKSEVEDRVTGLNSGANDYLCKPFDMRELIARLHAMTRARPSEDTRLYLANLVLDRATFELSTENGAFRLANKEFQMMELLMQNPSHIISVNRFMDKIWGYESNSESAVVWVYISYLRKKLSALGARVEIKVTRNLGYSLEETP